MTKPQPGFKQMDAFLITNHCPFIVLVLALLVGVVARCWDFSKVASR